MNKHPFLAVISSPRYGTLSSKLFISAVIWFFAPLSANQVQSSSELNSVPIATQLSCWVSSSISKIHYVKAIKSLMSLLTTNLKSWSAVGWRGRRATTWILWRILLLIWWRTYRLWKILTRRSRGFVLWVWRKSSKCYSLDCIWLASNMSQLSCSAWNSSKDHSLWLNGYCIRCDKRMKWGIQATVDSGY